MARDDDLDLRELAARAAFWWERLQGPYEPVSGRAAEEQRAAAVAAWRRAVDTPLRDNVGRRLAWDGLKLGDVEPWLGPVSLPMDAPLPAWTATLERLLAERALATDGADTPPGLLSADEPLPFAELFVPVVAAARRWLHADLDPRRRALFTAGAWQDLERGLLRRLCDLAASALCAELAAARPAGLSFLHRALPDRPWSGGTERYRALVESYRGPRLRRLWARYPVLARLVATALAQWVETSGELLARLDEDLPALRETFGHGEEPGPVASLRPDLSDRHNGGRTTAILTFASGLRLVYKPKDLAPDRLFLRLLAWCNENAGDGGTLLDLRLTGVLARDGYGWVEVIERRPCADRAAVRRFYRRAGQLLAIVHAVQGTDCHMENLIACGEYPVLVDHETLFFPEPRSLTDEPQAKAGEQLADSVLTTGLLPQWELDGDRLSFDSSGLGGEEAEDRPWWTPCWRDVNSDDMRRGRERTTPHEEHRPHLDGAAQSAVDHAGELVAGFRAAYRLLLERRQELLSDDGPLARPPQGAVRFLFRRTAVYARLLARLTAPQYLGDGVAYSLEMDLLSRAFLVEEERSHAWPVLAAELRAMAVGDVPFFTHRPTDRALLWDAGAGETGVLPSYFLRGSAERLRDGLGRLDEYDLAWQTRILETSFLTRRARKPVDRSEPAAGHDDPEPIRDEEAWAEAERLGAEIHATALAESDGSASWIGLAFAPRVERYQLENLDPQLYHGLSGIALFLAALHRVGTSRGEDDVGGHRDLALRALRRVQRDAADDELRQRVARILGLGGVSGVGSVIYALTRVADLVAAPELLETAVRLAETLTQERIGDDPRLDVLSGTAGALLSLLALAGRCDGSEATRWLERAVACGDHLIGARVKTPDGLAWPTLHGRPLTGFSHGAAGVAFALARLHAACGEARFLRAAEEGIAYETRVFSPSAGNWPDLRDEMSRDPSGFMTSWCHGAPGIALGRVAALDVLDTPAVRGDVEAGVATTLRFGAGRIDTVCCGTFGRVDVLHTVGRRLGRDELTVAARRLAARTVRRALADGGYRALSNLPPAATPPGFFMGLAGVGYTLLRLVEPALPSILSLE